MNRRCTFRKVCYHVLLIIRRLHNNRFKFRIRHWEVKLVGGFNIRNFLKHIHEFRKIKKLCKSGSGTIAGSFRSQLNSGGCFTKGRCPAVKMGQIFLLKCAVLKVSHNSIKLRHGVRYGSTCCKDNASPAGQFIHIAALHKHIRRFLCFRSGKTSDIPHFCVQKEVFESVALVYKQPINAQLFKGNNIILSVSREKFIQSGLQGFSRFLHLFDGEILAVLIFEFCNRSLNLINLFTQLALLTFRRKRDFFKLTVTDNDCIIVTGGNSRTEFLAVCRFKILFGCHQKFGTGIQMKKFICPLQGQMVGNNKQCLLAQSQAFTFHSGSRHFKGFARTNLMCQQGIPTIQHMGNGISLVFPKGYIGIHATKSDMATIVFTRSGGVKQFIILGHKCFTAVRVFPNPVSERILDCLLFLLCQSSFLFVQHTLLLAIRILNGVVDTNIFQIQSFL